MRYLLWLFANTVRYRSRHSSILQKNNGEASRQIGMVKREKNSDGIHFLFPAFLDLSCWLHVLLLLLQGSLLQSTGISFSTLFIAKSIGGNSLVVVWHQQKTGLYVYACQEKHWKIEVEEVLVHQRKRRQYRPWLSEVIIAQTLTTRWQYCRKSNISLEVSVNNAVTVAVLMHRLCSHSAFHWWCMKKLTSQRKMFIVVLKPIPHIFLNVIQRKIERYAELSLFFSTFRVAVNLILSDIFPVAFSKCFCWSSSLP